MANPVVLLASLFVLLLFCPFPFLLVGPASCNAHSTANACCKPCSPSPFPQKYKASMQLNGSLELEPWIAGEHQFVPTLHGLCKTNTQLLI